MLSGRQEVFQFRAASLDPYIPSLISDGAEADPADGGFGSRALILEPGETAGFQTDGEGVTVLWTRRPGGGRLVVSWCGHHVAAVDTDGPHARSRATVLRFPEELLDPDGTGTHPPDGSPRRGVSVAAEGGSVVLEGAYLHHRNLDSGVRVWPAVRAGARTRDFFDHPGWALDALGALDPDLVVVGTGTNDDSYADELPTLLDAIAERAPGVATALWLPPETFRFDPELAEVGRRIASHSGSSIIDANRVLGPLPTVDGVHATAVTVALGSVHAAGTLSEDPNTADASVAGVLASLSVGQRWRPGSGSIAITSMAGEPTVSASRSIEDAHPALALILDAGAKAFLGLPGGGLSLGSGGDLPLDTHLSRSSPGRLSINGGSGRLEVAGLELAVETPEATPSRGVVLHSRSGPDHDDLLVTFSDGGSRVLTSDGDALVLPMPCALGLHATVGGDVCLRPLEVVWVPAPPLAQECDATHAWVDVLSRSGEVTVTMALVAPGEGGLPGSVLASSQESEPPVQATGITGVAFSSPVRIPAGRRWWTAISLSGPEGSELKVRAAASLLAGARLHLGSAPVRPVSSDVDGSLSMGGVEVIPSDPRAGLVHRSDPAPIVHVSLQ